MSEMNFDTFTDVLRYLQMNTSLNARQIKTLICVGYFSGLGKTGKLMAVFDEFFEGKNKLTKQIKSYEKRLAINRQFESNQPDIALPIFETVRNENDLLGLCMSVEQSQPDNVYFVEEVEDKYGIKAK